MPRPWDNWDCQRCGRGMTLEAAAEGFCALVPRSPDCPLPVDLSRLEERAQERSEER